jgi:DNA-binding transcriptional LysR family regulator
VSLRTANLNLMPVLQELLKHQSVTKASHALGLSPSATSQALTQLRQLMDDPLLVRVGANLKLTPKAIELIGPLTEVCADLERLLERDSFQPKLAKREFQIASSDLFVLLLARPMMDLLEQEAPHIRMHFVDIGRDLTDRMAAREIDFALIPDFAIDDLAPAPLRFCPLSAGGAVALMSVDHPLTAQESVNQADLRLYQQVVFQPDAIMRDPKRALMPNGGDEPNAAVRIQQMTLLPHLLPGTRYIAIVSKQLADIATAILPLTSRRLAYRTVGTTMGLAWSPIYDRDLAHKWFRTLVGERLRRSPPSPPQPQ